MHYLVKRKSLSDRYLINVQNIIAIKDATQTTLKAVVKRKPDFFSGFLFAVAFVASVTAMLFCNPRFKHECILNILVDTYVFHDFLML